MDSTEPSGTNQINSTNLYFVFGNVSTLPNPPNLIGTVRYEDYVPEEPEIMIDIQKYVNHGYLKIK